MTTAGVASRRLCIVSRDRPLSAASVAALTAALGPGDELEIIMDRRGDGSATAHPAIERRHHPDVDAALERDGFAIVPTQTPRPIAPATRKSPMERLALDAADARELERVLGLKRRRRARLARRLIPAALAIGALALLAPAIWTFATRPRPAVPSVVEIPTPAPTPVVTPPPAKTEARAPSSAARVPATEERPRDASASTRAPAAPSATKGPPTSAAPSFVAGLPHADVTRSPAPTSEGGGETYVVRLSDSAGRPAAGAHVALLIRMANGRLLDIPLETGAEPGTYQTTVPPLDPAPVDLRIRIVASNRRVEIPLAP